MKNYVRPDTIQVGRIILSIGYRYWRTYSVFYRYTSPFIVASAPPPTCMHYIQLNYDNESEGTRKLNNVTKKFFADTELGPWTLGI